MSAPIRVQRKRKKGWRMPPNTVYVGRPSRWGNPCRDGHLGLLLTRFEDNARKYLSAHPAWLDALRGKNLACWCDLYAPCHADILLKLANPEE